MLRNYFKLAYRNLLHHKLHSFILLFGLSLGTAACLLLIAYVSYEWSFDLFHDKADRIYRVVNTRYQNGVVSQKGTITYPTIGPTLTKDFPEVEEYTRMTIDYQTVLQYEDKQIRIDRTLFSDEHFFEVFDFPTLAGNAKEALKNTNSIALSKQSVQQLFSVNNSFDQVLGKQIIIGDYPDPFSIQLVYENLPNNSTLQADALISYASTIRYWGAGANDSWQWSDFYHYLVLQPGVNPQQLNTKLDGFSQQYFNESETGIKEVFELQALKDAHLYSTNLEYEIGKTQNGRSIWALLLIGLVILIIAWVNYVNLSSVKAIEKAKEVGVRKVIGAGKGQLIAQFLVEAFLVNFIALTIALALVQVALRSLESFLDIPFSLQYLFQGHATSAQLISVLFALMLLGILSAAVYPAWLLGKQNVSNVLKGIYEKTGSSALLRKMLVVFQFATSVVLIIGTLMIFQQLQHMSQQDLGINVDQVLVVDGPELAQFDSTFIERFNVFKNDLKQYPGIQSATMSNRMPGERTGRTFQIRSSVDPNAPTYTAGVINIDYDYPRTFDLAPLTGRAFRQEDHNFNGNMIDKVMVNETAVQLFGYDKIDDIVGQKIYTGDRAWTVIGVLPDFHQRSLHHPIEAIMFSPFLGTNNPLAIRLQGQDIEGSIAHIQSRFDAFFPNNIFAYHFLDERFQQQYQSEQLFGKIILFFTLLTIIIACLGLFGLASYTAFLRTKEIGIRKVLGSSISGIMLLLSKDFLKLVLIAIIIAIPVAWYLSNNWLSTFHYRIELPWWTYALAGSLVLGISILTISYQSIKTAVMNPVDALRRE